MSRGLRMEPEIYSGLKQKIQSLDTTAAHITIPEGTTPHYHEKLHPPHSRRVGNVSHCCIREPSMRI